MAVRKRSTLAFGVGGALAFGATLLTPAVAQAGAPPSADLSVSVSHTPDAPVTADEITFTITATNDGPSVAEAVVAGIAVDYPLSVEELPSNCTRSVSNNSILCDLGDVASGASADVSLNGTARGSGLYTVPVAVTSPTPDPDTADRATTDTIIVIKGPSQAERYLKGIFPVVLDRDPGAAGLAYWSPIWKAAYFGYPRNIAKVPYGLISSAEYRGNRVDEAYSRILGRPADASSRAHWVSKLGKGKSYNSFEQALIGSNEWAGNHPADAVDAVYQAVLGRAPSAAESSTWTPRLAGNVPAYFLAAALQRSTEGYDVVIDDRYQRTVGSAPSALGRYFWQVRLREGVSPERLWSELLVSGQVLAEYPLTDDDYEDYYQEWDFTPLAPSLDVALQEAAAS